MTLLEFLNFFFFRMSHFYNDLLHIPIKKCLTRSIKTIHIIINIFILCTSYQNIVYSKTQDSINTPK